MFVTNTTCNWSCQTIFKTESCMLVTLTSPNLTNLMTLRLFTCIRKVPKSLCCTRSTYCILYLRFHWYVLKDIKYFFVLFWQVDDAITIVEKSVLHVDNLVVLPQTVLTFPPAIQLLKLLRYCKRKYITTD